MRSWIGCGSSTLIKIRNLEEEEVIDFADEYGVNLADEEGLELGALKDALELGDEEGQGTWEMSVNDT